MTFQNDDEVIKFIKAYQEAPKWVKMARDEHKTLNALVTGEGFLEELITRIEKLEREDLSKARKKYSKDIRDLTERIMSPRANVYTAAGGSITNKITSEERKRQLAEALTNFKGQKNIKQYLSENYFQLGDVDPNGVIFLEYKDQEDIYPTYKSIKDIRVYKSNGQLCEILMFEPKNVRLPGEVDAQKWRVVDDARDYTVFKIGSSYRVSEEFSFNHPFGKVPAIILSEKQKTGTEIRLSWIDKIKELMKDYARDKSILTIYKFQHGFPVEWRYEETCFECQGTGKTGNDQCNTCNGKGIPQVNDVTGLRIIRPPRESGDPVLGADIMGFKSPDFETWDQYKTDLLDAEDRMEHTTWGTKRVTEATNETATGRYIDVQPVMNRLSVLSVNAEWAHNQLAHWVENWVFGTPQEMANYFVAYGNRFIIESQDVILKKYSEAREAGDNNTVLDKLLDEYIWSKYQNNPYELNLALKKKEVEPYVHLSTKEVNDFYGSMESYKKVLFVDFWEVADKTKNAEQLKQDFKTYVNQNQLQANNNQ